jgi:hypothetical protein
MSQMLPARAYREVVDELTDSGGLVNDTDGLRRRQALASLT